MTNQVNQYERHMAIQEAYQIHDSDEYFKARPQLECGDRRKVFYAGHIRGYQAATQASESEINSLKERVEELQADNNQLREAIEISLSCVDEEINPRNYNGEILTKFINDYGQMVDILQKSLTATTTQSLIEHDNDVIQMCANEFNVDSNEYKTIQALKVTP